MTSVTQDAFDGRLREERSFIAIARGFVSGRLSLFAVLFLALIPLLYVPAQTGNHFLSDDMYMYLSTKQFAETGKLYFEDELTRDDSENLLHPRGFVTVDGRAVPYNFLGLPVIYGAAEVVLGDKVEYFGTALALLALIAIWGILGLLQGGDRRWTFPLVFLAYPFLYYLGRPYMNVVPSLAFLLAGVYFLLYYGRHGRRSALIAAGILFALEIFCRYPDIVLIAPLAGAILWQIHGKLFGRQVIRDAAILGATTIAVFGIPLLVLNQMTYGSPFTYGYSLFNDAYDANRGGSDAAGLAGYAATLGVWLLPGGFHPWILFDSVEKYLGLLTPVLLVLGVLGTYLLLRDQKIGRRYLLAYAALFIYVLVYSGSAAVWGTQFDQPTVGHTMARYWIIPYLMLGLTGGYVLLHSRDNLVRLALVAIAISIGMHGLFFSKDSLTDVKAGIDNGQTLVQQKLLPFTEEDAVIYTGRNDKFVVGWRQVAAWHNSATQSFYDSAQVASSMSKVIDKGRPAYIIHEHEAKLDELQNELEPYGLTLKTVVKGYLSEVVHREESAVTHVTHR